MQQGFNVDFATKFGLKEAIVFEIIKWYIYVKSYGEPTCIPLKLILKRAPYLSKGTLKRVIVNLERENLIYKRKGYDDLLGLGNIYEITEYGKRFA